jgi:hypothetical protein
VRSIWNSPSATPPVAKELLSTKEWICPWGAFVLSMSSASASEEAKSKKQKDIEDYLSKIKLREVFQVIFL